MAASIALAQSVHELPARSDVRSPAIALKWPNDVLVSGKKIAGFLLEIAQTETRWPAAVLGCGINVSAGAFPADLAHCATALALQTGLAVPRRRLAVRFLAHLQAGYNLLEQGKQGEVLEIWKSFSSMWNEAPVSIVEGNQRRNAVTCGLSDDGALLVKTESGRVETLLAGDVTVRSENKG
jgi:BirA family biotin operon repressor/biotin-[acetyl-CoA-carboxylase] ligase